MNENGRMQERCESWASFEESEDYDQNSTTSSSSKSTSLGTTRNKNATARLVDLMNRTGYRIEQVNGQRRYGPPPGWNRPQPQRGSEIFVGKVPRNCYEDELVPVFDKCGMIYELRLMMDFSGTTRGYCFVMYTKPEEADRAVSMLDNYEIRPGQNIGVVHSVNNCRLQVGGFPLNKTEAEIAEVLRRLTKGVESVTLCEKPIMVNKDRSQYVIVEYDSHRSAAMARRLLIPDGIQLWGRNILVDWAVPPNTNPSNLTTYLPRNPSKKQHTKTRLQPLVSSQQQQQVSKRVLQLPYTLEELMDRMLYGSTPTHNKENSEPDNSHCSCCHCLQRNKIINQGLSTRSSNFAPGGSTRYKGIRH